MLRFAVLHPLAGLGCDIPRINFSIESKHNQFCAEMHLGISHGHQVQREPCVAKVLLNLHMT